MTPGDSYLEEPITLFDKLCETYWQSKNNAVYQGLIPTSFIGCSFEEAALKIGKFNLNSKFSSFNLTISLIGVTRQHGIQNKTEYFYSPIGMVLEAGDHGIYIINNLVILQWMLDQHELDRIVTA